VHSKANEAIIEDAVAGMLRNAHHRPGGAKFKVPVSLGNKAKF